MLDVAELRAGYGNRIVLDGVSLSIARGERISLIGHNGAGKSTILKAITGQIKPVGGTIRFDGARIDGASPEAQVKRGIVQVPAGRRVFPQLSVRQNLEAGAFSRRDRTEIAADLDRMMQQFPVLARKARSRAGLLSGGEQQMLAIARGLMARPKLLLVDEPSLGLSPLMVDEVFAVLGGLADAGTALVLAEQNVRKALAMTDRAVVLSQGVVVVQMASERLLSDAQFRNAYLGGDIASGEAASR